MPNSSGFMTTADVAEFTGLSVYTINRYARSGKLPVAYQTPGSRGARLYRREDVEALLATVAS